jgi:hypothetical protein
LNKKTKAINTLNKTVKGVYKIDWLSLKVEIKAKNTAIFIKKAK